MLIATMEGRQRRQGPARDKGRHLPALQRYTSGLSLGGRQRHRTEAVHGSLEKSQKWNIWVSMKREHVERQRCDVSEIEINREVSQLAPPHLLAFPGCSLGGALRRGSVFSSAGPPWQTSARSSSSWWTCCPCAHGNPSGAAFSRARSPCYRPRRSPPSPAGQTLPARHNRPRLLDLKHGEIRWMGQSSISWSMWFTEPLSTQIQDDLDSIIA